jgi:hypothetical protein
VSAVLLPRILLRQPEHLHQANQAAYRAAVGPAYKDSGLVFTHPDGSPIHPHLFSEWFKRHVPRRGAAVDPLARPAPQLRDGGARRRHPGQGRQRTTRARTIAITMDTYSHVLPGLDKRAATTVARLILEGHEPEPIGSIDKPLTTGHVVPSTLDSPEGGEARNARSDGQRRRTGIEPA